VDFRRIGRNALVSGILLIVEGGGDRKSGRTDCRRGFRLFLERANVSPMPRIVAGGGRQQTYERFKRVISEGQTAYLLVDSEAPVDEAHRQDPWKHLKERDGWDKPGGATADQCHLMVQLLEGWFLADPSSVAAYFGKGFKTEKLGNSPDIEVVAKADVYERIRLATKDTRKGGYDKGRDTSDILAGLNAGKISGRSYFAKRFIDNFR